MSYSLTGFSDYFSPLTIIAIRHTLTKTKNGLSAHSIISTSFIVCSLCFSMCVVYDFLIELSTPKWAVASQPQPPALLSAPGQTKVLGADRAVAHLGAALVLEPMIAETATSSESTIAARRSCGISSELTHQPADRSISAAGGVKVPVDINATKELVLAVGQSVGDQDLTGVLAVSTSTAKGHVLTALGLQFDLDTAQVLASEIKQVLNGLHIDLLRGLHRLGRNHTVGQGGHPGHLLVAELTVAEEVADQAASELHVTAGHLGHHSLQGFHSGLLTSVQLDGLTNFEVHHGQLLVHSFNSILPLDSPVNLRGIGRSAGVL